MRLIDADKFFEDFPEIRDYEYASQSYEVEVEPVKSGRWEITEAYPHNVYCSVCYKRYAQTHWAVWEDGSLPRAYCPNCGAKMEEREA